MAPRPHRGPRDFNETAWHTVNAATNGGLEPEPLDDIEEPEERQADHDAAHDSAAAAPADSRP